ncbi:hypothetical protein [uncultured Chryseobacterium sp.]|uniref:hypothetical protein n=1 Tax=uncultured Chryseobacterium sp. TaxID=259322 RepID=UPI0025FAA433|nr:hypothetical protein [uncultured Chryseobacterium sp.]
MKKFLLTAGIILSGLIYSQVGVNNQTPSTTFDVRAKRDASGNITDNTQIIGMQAPRITLTELSAGTASYGTNQNGALIYITNVSGSNTTAGTQRENITAAGYYYFDAAAASNAGRWQKVLDINSVVGYTADNGITLSGSNFKLGGAVSEPTTLSGITATNKLSIIGSGVDAFNLAAGTLSADLTNKRIGINTTAPNGLLHVVNSTANTLTDTAIFGVNSSSGNVRNMTLFNNNTTNQNYVYVAFEAKPDLSGPESASLRGADHDAANNYSGISLFTRNATNLAGRMIIRANGKVGIGTNMGFYTVPDNSSVLETRTTTAGVLIPRMTTAQMNAIISPVAGLLVRNTDENCNFLYNGSYWRSMCTSTFQQSSPGPVLIGRGTSQDLTQSITLAGTQNITVQVSFNPQVNTNASNGYSFGTYSILIDGNNVTGTMRYATQNAGNNLYRYSSIGTWTTSLAPGNHTIIFRVTADTAANGATVDTNAEDRRMIVTVN